MYNKYTVNELKEILRKRDLPVSGIKKILIERLIEYDNKININIDTKVVCVKCDKIRPKYDNLKEWCDDKNNVYIGRKGIVFVNINDKKQRYPTIDSKWANPYKVGKDGTREEVIKKYEDYIREKIKENPDLYNIDELKNKTLGCWCKPESCHGDVLVKIINE